MAAPVHMVGATPFKLKLGAEVRTRCGLIATPLSESGGVYKMISGTGGDYRCTTLTPAVTCRKCSNLLNLGTLLVKEAS